jgi:CHAD domain-containing protein
MANSGITARMPQPSSVSPVATLREHAMKLEAAMLVCRASPKKEPVHTLRKATRYVEAQLALLQLVPHLPPHTSEADKVRKRLKTVRKAAGTVRDFDVQRTLVKDDVPAKPATDAGAHDGRMRRDAQALAKHLKRQREQETEKLTKALRKLEGALQPAEQRTIPATRLAASIEHWFHAHSPPPPTQRRNGRHTLVEEDALHALRKTSKLCRYMAESLPVEFPEAKRLTSLFEAIQESGGRWHDWLLLQQIAGKHHGNGAALTERYTRNRDAALAGYQSQLANLLSDESVRLPKAS